MPPASVYLTQNGRVHFKSDAPLELIEARSEELKGAIDIDKGTFAFTLEILSFKGFNSRLQREHFNENYLESSKYPKAAFVGKIIEKLDFSQNGSYNVRAKGKLSIHAVDRERIIKSIVTVKNGELHLQSYFTVLLSEHEIAIPKIVHQKIAEEIEVKVEAVFKKHSG